LQGEPIRWHSNFVMVSRCCKGFSLFREQGAFFGICREEQRGIANGCRVGRRFTLGTRRPHNSIVGPPHLAAVQKIVDALIQRDARDELTRLTHRLERLRFRAEPEGDAP
jgi:hypothetical protein